MNGEHTKPAIDPGASRRLQYQRSHMRPGTEIALKREHWVVGDAATRQGLAIVFESEDIARLFAAAPDLLALAKQYASECADCGGTGRIVTRSGGSGWGDGGPDVHEEAERCGECEDIRAVIAKAEGRS